MSSGCVKPVLGLTVPSTIHPLVRERDTLRNVLSNALPGCVVVHWRRRPTVVVAEVAALALPLAGELVPVAVVALAVGAVVPFAARCARRPLQRQPMRQRQRRRFVPPCNTDRARSSVLRPRAYLLGSVRHWYLLLRIG